MYTAVQNIFVTCDLAKRLRRFGFAESCLAYYNAQGKLISEIIDGEFVCYNQDPDENHPSAPSYTQVLEWLQFKYGVEITIWVDISIITKCSDYSVTCRYTDTDGEMHKYSSLRNPDIKKRIFKCHKDAYEHVINKALDALTNYFSNTIINQLT